VSLAAAEARARRTWPQRLLIAVNLFLIVAALVTAAGLGYFNYKIGQLPRIRLGSLTQRQASSEPQNFLLVGVDSAAGLDPTNPIRYEREQEGVSGLRSDTIMILRIDPNSSQASRLSLPRDLWVPIAGTGGRQRINTAINAGPARLIDTIQQDFNIPIHHYVQVDFFGFQQLVNAVDGVPVWFAQPVRDRNTGLDVQASGCVTLSGDQALAFARSRHYEVFVDGRWRTDPTGDLGRISRQQDFIRRAIKQSVSKGVRSPMVLNDLIGVAVKNVTIDDRLSARDIFQLGRRFRSFNPDNLIMYDVPAVDANVGGAAVLRLDEERAAKVFDIFRGVQPGDIAPSSVRVRVLNGTGTSGQAGSVARSLAGVGFVVTGTGDAESFAQPRTTVRYTAGNEAAADLVARWVDGGADLQQVDQVSDAQVALVVGRDWHGLRAQASPPTKEIPTTTTTVAPGAAPTTTTTRQVIGDVPTSPPPEVHCG
jgi:LCP family protein required for cell wall assembly